MAINEEMRAAFPKEELSEGAEKLIERLRVRLENIFCLEDVVDEEAEAVILCIVTELGIDAELVESLRIRLGTRAHDRAAGVMEILLEVAGK